MAAKLGFSQIIPHQAIGFSQANFNSVFKRDLMKNFNKKNRKDWRQGANF